MVEFDEVESVQSAIRTNVTVQSEKLSTLRGWVHQRVAERDNFSRRKGFPSGVSVHHPHGAASLALPSLVNLDLVLNAISYGASDPVGQSAKCYATELCS